jgi:glycosyltransferase involved in cell wall biosynthesis
VSRRTKPTVSVVLPTYERRGVVGRAIQSVLDQTYGDFELIIVDDGSTDSTLEVVASLDDRRIRCIRLERNLGPAGARNVGIDAAAGRFVAFQDSDDEWLPTKLGRHMRVFDACGPEIGVVYSDMERIHLNGIHEYHRSPDVLPGRLIDPGTGFYQVCNLGIQSTVIRRECLTAVGGFNEEFPALEDLELFVRLSTRSGFRHLPVPLVRYHETAGISQNMPAKLVARALLLQLYGDELGRRDMSFVEAESAALERARQPTWHQSRRT